MRRRAASRGTGGLAVGFAAAVLGMAAVAWVLFVPFAGWLAHHDVGSAKGSLYETAVDNARNRLLTFGAGLFAAGALVFTGRTFYLSREGQVTESLSQVSGCLSCQHEISLERLLPHLAGVIAEAAEMTSGLLCIWARARADHGVCPRCSRSSSRVHSSYGRRLADAPVGGHRVLVRLAVRRFFCGNPGCPAVTFAEQVAGLTSRRARRTPPLARMLTMIALALAGRPGARLARGWT